MNSVLLVEGHRLLRNALKDLLTANGFVGIVEAIDPIEAIVKTNLLAPRIIVLETAWDGVRGVYLSRMLRELAPESRIVLLVDEEWNAGEDEKQSSGADAYIAKNVLMDELPKLLAGWREKLLQPAPLAI